MATKPEDAARSPVSSGHAKRCCTTRQGARARLRAESSRKWKPQETSHHSRAHFVGGRLYIASAVLIVKITLSRDSLQSGCAQSDRSFEGRGSEQEMMTDRCKRENEEQEPRQKNRRLSTSATHFPEISMLHQETHMRASGTPGAPECRSVGERSPSPEQLGAPEVRDTLELWVLRVSKHVILDYYLLHYVQVDQSRKVAKSTLSQQTPFTRSGCPRRPCRNVQVS